MYDNSLRALPQRFNSTFKSNDYHTSYQFNTLPLSFLWLPCIFAHGASLFAQEGYMLVADSCSRSRCDFQVWRGSGRMSRYAKKSDRFWDWILEHALSPGRLLPVLSVVPVFGGSFLKSLHISWLTMTRCFTHLFENNFKGFSFLHKSTNVV